MFGVLYGIHDRLAELGYDLVLVSTTTARQRLVSYLTFCTERRLDGVIVMGIRMDDPYIQEVLDSGFPSVVIDVPLLSERCGYVMTDNVFGAKLAVRHLFAKGHRVIGFVNGHVQAAVSRERRCGYEEAMAECGLVGDPDWQFVSDFTERGGMEGCKTLLEKNPDMTAIFFASDLMAMGGLRHAQAVGLKVPSDLSVVGFDDIELSQYVTPSLSTIHQKRYEMGTVAADMLVGMLDQGKAPEGRLLSPQLFERQST